MGIKQKNNRSVPSVFPRVLCVINPQKTPYLPMPNNVPQRTLLASAKYYGTRDYSR